MPEAPFVIIPEYSAIAIGLPNEEGIADEVAPRVPTSKPIFNWEEYDLNEQYVVQDDVVGRTSAPNQIETTSTRKQAEVIDRGLDYLVPQVDVDAAEPGQDPLARGVMLTSKRVQNNREKRVADVVMNPATYPAGQVTTLVNATDRFNDFTNSDPIGVITTLLSGMARRANYMAIGRAGWDILKRHSKLINAITGQAGVTNGVARREAIADLLEIEGILVGESWINTAAKGQAPVRARAWGGTNISFFYKSPLGALTQGEATFMLTAQWGQRIAGLVPDPDIGLRGGQKVRSGESVKEIVVANVCGAMIENAFA